MNDVDYTQRGMAARLARQGHAPAQNAHSQPVGANPGLRTAILGLNTSPELTAALRALLYIVLVAALNVAVLYLTTAAPAWIVVYNVILIAALREIEGVLDGYFKGNG